MALLPLRILISGSPDFTAIVGQTELEDRSCVSSVTEGRFNKHMIDDPGEGRRRAPGNRGRKWPPLQTGFLTLPPGLLPEHPDDEHNGDKNDQVDHCHTDLRHRFRVETETRSCAAASRVDR